MGLFPTQTSDNRILAKAENEPQKSHLLQALRKGEFCRYSPLQAAWLSQIGLLAVLLSVAPETKFRAENFGKFTYEDVSVSAANLSDLERFGYVRRVS